MRVEELLAREGVRATISLYNRAVDDGRYEALTEVFAADATMAIQGGPTLEGLDAITAALKAGAARRDAFAPGNFQRHNMTSSMIEVADDETASARHYIIVMTELGLDHCGLYDDRYRRSGDRWLIERREARMEWSRPDSRFVQWLGQGAPAKSS